MNDHDHMNDTLRKYNQLMHNAQTGVGPGRVAPPMPTTSVQTPSLGRTTTSTATTNNVFPRSVRRYNMPMQNLQHYMPSAAGPYNNYPYSRPYMNMNMNMGGYSPYSTFGQPMTNQYQNPVVIAAAESSRPAFESIQSVVQSFNAVSMMLESTFTAMHMSFQALLGVAENFTRLRMFMMKLYSTIVSFKLARWFLTKLFYLLKMVRGDRGSTVEEELWTALSSTAQGEVVPSDGRSWPLVVFTGLLVATPYFVYKLLNSVTPLPNQLPSNNVNGRTLASEAATDSALVFTSPCDWSHPNPKALPLKKGKTYMTTNAWLAASDRYGGWFLVEDSDGRKGYVPLSLLQHKTASPSLQSIVPEMSNETFKVAPSVISEDIQPSSLLTMPISDVLVNPAVLPPDVAECEKLKNGVQ